MAKYNTFALIDTKTKKVLMITSSARKSKKAFVKGHRIEVWSANALSEVIYNKNIANIDKYIRAEKEYIGQKQRKVEERNKRRKKKFEANITDIKIYPRKS